MITKYSGGARLKEARKRIGISQKDLAHALNLSPVYLSLIETERQPISEPIAIKMRDLYGVDARWLLYGIAPKGEKSRLRIARDELGLKQKDLALQLGISAQYLGMMDRGDQPLSESVAMKIQELFGYSAEWICSGKGNGGNDGESAQINYDELTGIISELEFNADMLENIASNGRNNKANRYIRNAAESLRHALSDLSDADFETSTSSDFVNYGKE